MNRPLQLSDETSLQASSFLLVELRRIQQEAELVFKPKIAAKLQKVYTTLDLIMIPWLPSFCKALEESGHVMVGSCWFYIL